MGTVTDAATGDPVPFANVWFHGTTIGVTTNYDGTYSIETTRKVDTLAASFMGYQTQKIAILPNRFQTIHFTLQPQQYDLPEVIITAGVNPAEVMFRKILKHKDENRAKNFDHYQYEAYNKIEIDANNISEKTMNRSIFKPFRFIFDYMDTSLVNGKSYLPIFISETLSDIYFRKEPKTQKEVIKAVNVSGVKNESVMQFFGNLFQQYDFYDNYITLFQKNFISPIASSGLSNYYYHLVDSGWRDKYWCYKIMFQPKRTQELTFTGYFWVNDTTWAIKEFEMAVAHDANINYINDLVLSQQFERIDGKYWMVTRDAGIADFNVIEESNKVIGFFGRKTTTYRNFRFDTPLDPALFRTPVNVVVQNKASAKDPAFWKEHRHEPLTQKEERIYQMIDTLQNLPAFKTWTDIVETVVTGYYDAGRIELGPYASVLSFNPVEGTRLRIGGQTTAMLNEYWQLGGHLAYGTKDKKWKYGGSVLYQIQKNPRKALSARYRYDIEQLGNSPNAFREDFLFAAIFRRNPADKLSMTRELDLSYEHEWFNGLMNTFRFRNKQILPISPASVEIIDGEGVKNLNSIITSELSLTTRMAWQEKFLLGEFRRFSVGTKYPVVELEYAYGIPGLMGSNYEYHRAGIRVRQWFNIGRIGWSRYSVEAGKIWGTLPFPLLHLSPGNETFIFDEYAFNLMNYFEFISDQYFSAYYTHHFDGLFFNRIPLFRKLKWREVVHARMVVGTLSESNEDYNNLPKGIYTPTQPYAEAGAGIENIFKIIRIDAVWRLSHTGHPGTNSFGLFGTLYFTF
ncbi:MAG: DUF5686 and carboxypeptidase-like regulatory domain-containing protein [Bacteroidales bacterium]